MRLRDLAIVLGLALLALLFWKLRVIDPGTTLASAGPPWKLSMGNGDMFGQIYPGWHRAIRLIQTGGFPLWNPYQFAGHPLHASVLYGIFYPLNLSRFFLSNGLALEVTAALHLVAAGLFMYLYGRVIRLGRPAAAVAALVFMLSGSIVLRAVWFTPAIGAAVWLPLAFLAVEKIFRSPRLAWVALLAVAVAMPILAGWLQIWMYTMHAVGLYAGVRWLALLLRSDRRQRALPIGGLVAGGIVLGLLLAAVQLLPSWELQQLGPRRPGGLSVEQTITNWGAGPPTSTTLISHLTDPRPRGFPRRGYVGMLAFVLAPLSLLARAGRVRVAFLWLLASWSIAVALTTATPLFDLYRMLPAATWFREPWRILFLYTFAAAVLSGIGFDQLTRREPAASRRMLLAAALSTLVGLVLVLAIDLLTLSRAYLGVGLALLWGTVLLRRSRYRHALLALLVALLAADLFVANRSAAFRPFQALEAYHSEDDLFGFIERNQKLQRTFIAYPWAVNAGLIPKQGSLRGIFSITDYEILNLERYGKLYRAMSLPGWGINRAGVAGKFNGSVNLEFTRQNLALLDLMSVRFIALDVLDGSARNVLQTAGWQLAHQPRRSRFLVYENPRALTRAYLVHDADLVATEQEAFRAIRRKSFQPRRSVILEASAEAIAAPTSAGAATTGGKARIVRFQPSEVVIETNARAPGFLVLTDTFYPGWKASVDGDAQPIHRANYLFRAVRVPTGRHTVRFRYQPTSFRAGAAISLAALTGILLLFRARPRESRDPIFEASPDS